MHLHKVARVLLICLLAPVALLAQDNPLTSHHKFMFGSMKKILVRAAESMPEENYSFKPVDSVRPFGRIVGHIADAQYVNCSAVLGEKNPAPGIEKNKTSKADLIAGLKEALSYCDRAYEGLTDATAAQLVKRPSGDTPKLGLLTVNQVHSIEHYGNLITYLRMKGVVPPTSDPQFMKELMQAERPR